MQRDMKILKKKIYFTSCFEIMGGKLKIISQSNVIRRALMIFLDRISCLKVAIIFLKWIWIIFCFFNWNFMCLLGMAKRLKIHWKIFTETEKNKSLKLKKISSVFWKIFLGVLCLKKLKIVNKTLKTENIYWKLYFTENLFSVDD